MHRIAVMEKIDITDLRRRLGSISQSDLANRIGVNQATISRWENGDQDPTGPAERLLRRLADEAGVVQ